MKVKNRKGSTENKIIDKIKHWLLFLAWKPNPVNLSILKKTNTIKVSFKIPNKKDTNRIIIDFVIVKYNPSRP